MSHQPERKEKNCLNCGVTVAGRYCQNCGQENIVPKQSFWGLITHFIYDIFHFDGKFFHTLQRLLFRPGFVPREYIAGKRMSYLDPIRMYLFTSALFFLIFFSLKNPTEDFVNVGGNSRSMTRLERLEYASILHHQVKTNSGDTLIQKQLNYLLDTSFRIQLVKSGKPDNDSSFMIGLHGAQYLMQAHKRKPNEGKIKSRSGWIEERLNKQWKAYKQKYADDDKAMLSDLVNSFIHKFPYILFVSLPFFALILKLLYIRRKQFLYSDHSVFTLYHYIFTFILLLFYFLLLELHDWTGLGVFSVVATLLFLSGGVYLFIAMKRFYGQKWWKTLGKFLLLNFLALIVVSFILIAFILLSVFQF